MVNAIRADRRAVAIEWSTGTARRNDGRRIRMWDEDFERVVRAHLQFAADQPLAPATRLADHGLDSMETVSLLVEMEETFAVSFPDELLVAETFETPEALWRVLSGLLPVPR
jgi:acyl carrier protein